MKFQKIDGRIKSKILICEGYLYNYDHTINEKERWWCLKKPCDGAIYTTNDKVIN